MAEGAFNILFWVAYVLGVYKINEIVERWPNHIIFVLLGFMTILGWLVLLVAVSAVWYTF